MEPSSGSNVIPRRARPSLAGAMPHSHTNLSQTPNSQLTRPDAPLFVLIILGRKHPEARTEQSRHTPIQTTSPLSHTMRPYGQLGQDEQWLQRHPEAGSSWPSWSKASYIHTSTSISTRHLPPAPNSTPDPSRCPPRPRLAAPPARESSVVLPPPRPPPPPRRPTRGAAATHPGCAGWSWKASCALTAASRRPPPCASRTPARPARARRGFPAGLAFDQFARPQEARRPRARAAPRRTWFGVAG